MASLIFRPDIQGLRAVSVIGVMAFHFNSAWLPSGFVGVDIFLVISGFLITRILLERKDKSDFTVTESLKYFYVSRFKRIVPAYLVMLTFVALLASIFFLPSDFNVFKDGLEKAVWFNSNSYFSAFGDYFAPANYEQPLLHTWSLAVEVQFYILAPFLVLLMPVDVLKRLLIVLLVVLMLITDYRLRIMGAEQDTYYSLYARLPEFFAGMLAAIYIHSPSNKVWRKNSLLGVGLVAFSVLAQEKLGVFPGFSSLLPTVGAVLILLNSKHDFVTCLLSNRILVWIGALSYSLYIWHWPVLAFLRYYTGTEVLDSGASWLFVALTLLFASASYYLVERQFCVKQTKLKQKLGWVLLFTAIIATSQSMAKVNSSFTQEQLPIEYRRYADPENICHGKIVGECLKGDLDSSNEVLVLGDSHAAMLNNFFDYLGAELGFKARIISASSCITIPGFDYKRIEEWSHKECLNQIRSSSGYISKVSTLFLAASWNWQLASDDLRDALNNFVTEFSNTQIYIIGQEPLLKRNPQRSLRFNSLGWNGVAAIDPDYHRTNLFLQKLAWLHSNVHYLSFEDLDLFSSPPFYKGDLIYYDEHHINEVGIAEYAKQALPAIRSSLSDQ